MGVGVGGTAVGVGTMTLMVQAETTKTAAQRPSHRNDIIAPSWAWRERLKLNMPVHAAVPGAEQQAGRERRGPARTQQLRESPRYQSPQSYDFLRGGAGAGPQRRRPRVDRVSTEKRLDYHPLGDSLFGAKAWSDACPMPAQVLQSVAYILLPPHDIDELIDMSSRESIAVVNVPRAVSHAVRVLADELM